MTFPGKSNRVITTYSLMQDESFCIEILKIHSLSEALHPTTVESVCHQVYLVSTMWILDKLGEEKGQDMVRRSVVLNNTYPLYIGNIHQSLTV